MEKYDPNGKKAHEIAKKYQKKYRMADKPNITINGKERDICYGSWYEVNGGVPEGVTDHSLGPLGDRMLKLEYDSKKNKADKLSEKYRD